jgi:cell division protein FtsB
VDKLKHVTIGKGTVDELKADVADVQAKLSAVRTEAHGQAQAQISAMEASIAKLQSEIKTLTSNFSISAVPGTVSALRDVAASASSLLAALSKQCPSASVSPSA